MITWTEKGIKKTGLSEEITLKARHDTETDKLVPVGVGYKTQEFAVNNEDEKAFKAGQSTQYCSFEDAVKKLGPEKATRLVVIATELYELVLDEAKNPVEVEE